MNYLKNVSRETKNKLEFYVETLLKWNRKINLIGKSTESIIWERHIEDCWRLQDIIICKNDAIVDLGSGAGLPGLLFSMNDYTHVTLIESDLKKTAFLRHIKGQLNLNTKIIEDRIENHLDIRYDWVTARAFASVVNILPFATKLLKNTGKVCLLKGTKIADELKEAQQQYLFEFELIKSQNSNFGQIVIISKIEAKKNNEHVQKNENT